MSIPAQSYVYVHRYAAGPRTGEIFYVGKGTGRRLNITRGRNPHWCNIVNKYGFSAEIVLAEVDEALAFEFEELLTETIGLRNLANACVGGGGTRGYVPSDAELARRRLPTGRPPTPENLEKLVASRKGAKASKETREKMRAANTLTLEEMKSRGFTRQGTKWSANMREKLLDPDLRKKIGIIQRKPMICSNGLVFGFGGDAEVWLKANGYPKATKSVLSECCRGKRKTAYGLRWEFLELPNIQTGEKP